MVGAVALDAMLEDLYVSNYRSIFLTYYTGYQFLKSMALSVVDVLEGNLHIQQSSFCTPFGLETRQCVREIEKFQPDIVFNDGEPYLIEVTRDILGLPTIVLAHPADIYSPTTNSKLAIDLFRYYYAKADLVIAHGLERLPVDCTWLGGRAGYVCEVNTIVRGVVYQQAIAQQSIGVNADPFVLGILGGGSKNVSPAFREGTQTFGEWLIQACNDLDISQATLYCADEQIYEALRGIARSGNTTCTLIADPRDNSADIIRADVVVGRAGRNLLSELITLGKKGIVIPVGAEKFRGGNQMRTAQQAIQLNPNLQLALLEEGYNFFRECLQRSIALPATPLNWQPGNAAALRQIQSVCGEHEPKQY